MAQSQTEAAIYVATGVVESQRITIVGPVWGDAYHLKAYALIELGRLDDARGVLSADCDLAAQCTVLGSSTRVQTENNGRKPSRPQVAEEAAREVSPPQLRSRELARSMRGVASRSSSSTAGPKRSKNTGYAWRSIRRIR